MPSDAAGVGRWRRVADPIGWSLYLLIPAAGWPLFDGAPLAPIEAVALALVWWAWCARGALAGGRGLAVLVVMKLVLATQLVEHGFTTRVYSTVDSRGPVERSTEVFWRGDVTRRDARLSFGPDRGAALPLGFRNDLRFNFYREDQPPRDAIPYSIAWDGAIRSSAERSAVFYVAADAHATTTMVIDDQPVIPPGARGVQAAKTMLSAGWHRVTVRVSSTDGRTREVHAGEIVDGHFRPFGPGDAFTRAFRPSRMIRDAVARWAGTLLDLIVGVTIGGMALGACLTSIRKRRVGQVLWLAAIAEAFWFAWPWAARGVVLSGGDDWLTYEHLARAIALGDPLLLKPGLAPGQAAPFYYQPLYPYFLALTHLIGGDAFFLAVLVQRLLLAASAGWLAAMAVRLFGPQTRWPAIVVGAAFMYLQVGPWTSVLLSEPLFIPLMIGWVALLVSDAPSPGDARSAWTGVLGGVASLVRTTLLLAWPPALACWVAAVRARRVRAALILGVAASVTVATVSVRNAVVSRGAIAPASSFAINFYLGNQPTHSPAPPPASRVAMYERLHLAETTRLVLESAAQEPAAFTAHLKAKTVYALGFFDWSGIKPGYSIGLLAWPGITRLPGTSWALVALWCAAAAGLVRVVLRGRTVPVALLLLPLLVALSQLAVVVIFFPHIYGDRLILPWYPLLVPYAAAAVSPAGAPHA